MTTIDGQELAIAELKRLIPEWEGRAKAARAGLEELEAESGERVVAGVLSGEAVQAQAAVLQDLQDARARIDIADRTVAGLTRRLYVAETELVELQAEQMSGQVADKRAELEAHNEERDRLLGELEAFEGGGRYVQKDPPTFEQLVSHGRMKYTKPTSVRLADELAQLEGQQLRLEKTIKGRRQKLETWGESEAVLNYGQAAAAMGVPVEDLREMIARGEVPGIPKGRGVLQRDVERLIKARA